MPQGNSRKNNESKCQPWQNMYFIICLQITKNLVKYVLICGNTKQIWNEALKNLRTISLEPKWTKHTSKDRKFQTMPKKYHWARPACPLVFHEIIFLKKIDFATAKLMKENEKNRIRICKVITTGCGDGTSLTDEMGEKKEIN